MVDPSGSKLTRVWLNRVWHRFLTDTFALFVLWCRTASMAWMLVHKFVARWQQHRLIMRVFLFTHTNVPWQVGNFLFKWVSLRNSSLPPTLCVLIFLLIFNQHFTLFKVEKYQKVFWCPLYLQRNRPKILELTETFTWSSWQTVNIFEDLKVRKSRKKIYCPGFFQKMNAGAILCGTHFMYW